MSATLALGQLPVCVYLIGPESTGKTRVFQALKERLHLDSTNSIPEVARRICIEKGWTGHTTNTIERQMYFLEQHLAEEAARADKGVAFVTDRSTLDCVAYAKLLVEGEGWRSLIAGLDERGALERYRRGLVVLFEPVEAFIEEDDGIRVQPPSMERWWRIHSEFVAGLDAMAIPVGLRMGAGAVDMDARVSLVIQAMERIVTAG